MSKNNHHSQHLESLMNALADDVLSLTNQDVLEEFSGPSHPDLAAEEVRLLLRKSVKTYRQRHLRAAEAEYQKRVDSLQTRWIDLPDSAEERRALLASVFSHFPTMQAAFLTVQHRDFKELSDSDVETCLMHLSELGVLDQLEAMRDESNE